MFFFTTATQMRAILPKRVYSLESQVYNVFHNGSVRTTCIRREMEICEEFELIVCFMALTKNVHYYGDIIRFWLGNTAGGSHAFECHEDKQLANASAISH